MKKNKIVLLDSHAIIHRAYHALPDFTTRNGTPTGGLYGTFSILLKIIDELKPNFVIACYDVPQPTFRHEAYDEYKGGRKKIDSDLIEQIIKSKEIFKAFNIPIFEKAGFEADDIIGTISEILKKDKKNEIFIATGDMDTLQLVDKEQVKVYTLKNGNNTIVYDKETVIDKYNFAPKFIPDYKGLAGDPSDNIPGIRGIGDKTAKILISSFGSIEDIYKNLKKNNLEKIKLTPRVLKLLKEGEEEALFSKELATIKRDVEINFSLPQKEFFNNLDLSKIGEVCRKFEFRNILNRLKKILKIEESEQVLISDQQKLEELKVAVHLLNPTITEPTLDDVLNFS